MRKNKEQLIEIMDMKHYKPIGLLMMAMALPGVVSAQLNDSILLDNIVVTGTRHETDVRHLPMTVTTLSHDKLMEQHRSSILPTLNEQVPGLFTTSRGVLGYGVSNGAAGAFTLRGVGGSSPNAGVLVLIDGMPQYAGLYGHSIADAYQTMLAERVEVLRGTGLGSVWLQCHGRCGQHRYPTDEGGWSQEPCPPFGRFLWYGAG